MLSFLKVLSSKISQDTSAGEAAALTSRMHMSYRADIDALIRYSRYQVLTQ